MDMETEAEMFEDDPDSGDERQQGKFPGNDTAAKPIAKEDKKDTAAKALPRRTRRTPTRRPEGPAVWQKAGRGECEHRGGFQQRRNEEEGEEVMLPSEAGCRPGSRARKPVRYMLIELL